MPDDTTPPRNPTFEITHETNSVESLVVGLSHFGLAGLTAVDYLIDHLELEQVGHITVAELPSITPFEEGKPRHHTRLFSRSDLDLTLLVGELFVPTWAATPFSEKILEWTAANDANEITLLSGVPIPHGPEQHQVFYVATDEYRERRLAGTELAPMGTGFLDGINASLLGRGIDSPLDVGVLVTPVHGQVPDVEAALRLLEAVEGLYDLDIDTNPLKAFSEEVAGYYEELSTRLQSLDEHERPDDRMYM